MDTGVIGKLGVTAGDDCSGGGTASGGEWTMCAKADKTQNNMGITNQFNVYVDVINTAIMLNPAFVNANILYVGNGRFQNLTGAPITVTGFMQGSPYSNGLTNYNLVVTVGLWNGANIVPEVPKELSWPTTVGVNVGNANIDEHTYEYDLVVPANGIWGFAIKRTNNVLINNDCSWRTFSHTLKAVA